MPQLIAIVVVLFIVLWLISAFFTYVAPLLGAIGFIGGAGYAVYVYFKSFYRNTIHSNTKGA